MSVSAQQRDVFLHQAAQAEGRSQLYARLCRELADDPRVAEIIEPEPRWDAALRLLGGVHYLVLTGRATWERIEEALVDERQFLRRFAAEQKVQTNEVQRCWVLLPCFLEATQRLGVSTVDVVELGTSAGLLLSWPRLGYRYRSGEWGAADASLELAGEERGPVPTSLLRESVSSRRRVGIDLYPIDVTTDEGALLLKSFVWADRPDRLERLERAIEVFREDPAEVLQGDFVDLLPELLAARPADSLTIVVQVAAGGYLTAEGWERLAAALEEAGRDGPLAYVFAGKPADGSDHHWGVWLTIWPGGRREEVALADFHGSWVDWR